jgi:hypothetical protein
MGNHLVNVPKATNDAKDWANTWQQVPILGLKHGEPIHGEPIHGLLSNLPEEQRKNLPGQSTLVITSVLYKDNVWHLLKIYGSFVDRAADTRSRSVEH